MSRIRRSEPLVFVSYQETKAFVKKLGITMYDDWIKWCKENKKYRQEQKIPSSLSNYYKEFTSWHDFVDHKDFVSFEEAKVILQKYKIKNVMELQKWYSKNKALRKKLRIPTQPHKVYKKEWKGTQNYLGTELMTFEKAKEVIQLMGISTVEEYRTLGQQGKLPFGIPHQPDQVYSR